MQETGPAAPPAALRPRVYQQELFEKARKQNVIAYLDTGAGKTLISVLLLKDKADGLRANGKKKVSAFVAPKVDLVIQQAEVFKVHTHLAVQHFVGSMGVDFWDRAQWRYQIEEKCDVLVMTPQILLNILNHGFLKMEEVNLLVFDEAHHVKKGDPTNQVMQNHYFTTDPADRPHIFGMTASPLNKRINGDAQKITTFLDELERNLDSKVITVVDRSQVEAVTPSPEEIVVTYPPSSHHPAVIEVVEMLDKAKEALVVVGRQVCHQMHQQSYKMAGFATDAPNFDREKLNTESLSVGRDLGILSHTLQELGPWAALVAASALLRPRRKTIYNHMLSLKKRVDKGREHQSALEEMLGRLVHQQDDDCGWDGADMSMRLGLCSHTATEDEHRVLCKEVGQAVNALIALVLPNGVPGLPKVVPLDDMEETWLDTRRHISALLEKAATAVSERELDSCFDEQEEGDASIPLVTPKAMTLFRQLLKYKSLAREEPKPGARKWSCLVFAERKCTVLALNRFIKACPKLRFLRSSVLMGYGSRVGATPVDFKEQQQSLMLFKRGELNCLVCTSVAEEGLDLTACRLVVRFNPPGRALEFIQSRGRARAANSHMIVMLEEGNAVHQELLWEVRQCEAHMREEASRRTLNLNNDDGPANQDEMANMMAAEKVFPPEKVEYRVKSTGARVSLKGAKQLIFLYCSKLPSDKYAVLRPRFRTKQLDKDVYVSEVVLPNNSAVTCAQGYKMLSRFMAVSSACLVAVRKLHEAGCFTDYLVPSGDSKEAAVLTCEDDEEASKAATGPLPPAVALHAAVPLAILPSGWQRQERTWEALEDYTGPTSPAMPAKLPVRSRSGAVPAPAVPQPRNVTDSPRPNSGSSAQLVNEGKTAGNAMPASPPQTPARSGVKRPAESFPLPPQKVRRIDMGDGASDPVEGPDSSAERPAKRGPQLDPYPPPGPMHLYGLIARPSHRAASSAAPPQSANLQPRMPITEVLERQALGLLVPRPLPNLDAFNINMPGRDECTIAMRYLGAYDFSPGERMELAKFHQTLLTGRRMKSRTGDESAAEAQLVNMLQQLRSASAEAAQNVAAEVHKTTQGGSRKMNKRKAGERSGPGEPEPVIESKLLPAGFGRFTLVPLDNVKRQPDQPLPVDWKAVRRCLLGLVPGKDLNLAGEEAKDALVVTPYNQFLYRVLAIRRDCSILQPMGCERGVAPPVASSTNPTGATPVRPRNDKMSFKDYYKSRWKITELDEGLPMLECESLQKGGACKVDDTHVLLAMDICLVHPLSFMMLQLSALAPYFLFWLQVHLMAVELRDTFFAPAMEPSKVPSVAMVWEACMPMGCHQEKNYERLEILGDAFLKYAASLYVYTAHPNWHEGQMTLRKMSLISNKALTRVALRMGLSPYLTLNPDIYEWDNGRPEGTMNFRSKVLADLVEALIGAAFVSGGVDAALNFLDYHNICKRACGKPTGNTLMFPSNVPRGLTRLLDYEFKNPLLAREAFTHCSWPDEGIACYQRMEFLGDAVLDLLISQHYILGYKDLVPGQLHDLRSASLNNNRLACIAGRHGLQRFLLHCSQSLFAEVSHFNNSLKEMLRTALIDVRERGRTGLFGATATRIGQYKGAVKGSSKYVPRKATAAIPMEQLKSMTDERVLELAYNAATAVGFGKEGGMACAPKVLGDLVESLVGAVFLDCDADLGQTWKVVRRLLEPLVDPATCPIHPVRMVLEKSSKMGLPRPEFKVVPCEQEGFVAMDCVIEKPGTCEPLFLLGRCPVAPNTATARLISAERALSAWDENLPKLHDIVEMTRIWREEARIPQGKAGPEDAEKNVN